LVLGLLADLASADVDESDPTVFGAVTKGQCLAEIYREFPVYVEILESGMRIHSRTACIEPILMCGLSDMTLRSRSICLLRAALALQGLAEHRDVIRSSIEELSR
jgi:hypothetical protein